LTRDAVVATWRSHGREVRLIDTAGLRRRPKIAEGPEALAVTDALRAIRFAEVVILVLDATQEIGKQDLALAALIEAEGRAPVIVLNKWDLVDHKRARLKAVRQALEAGFAQAKGVALVALSALSRAGLEKLMPQVLRAHALWNRRLRTPALNRWLAAASERHPPPQAPGARIKLRFVTQVNTRPPTFALLRRIAFAISVPSLLSSQCCVSFITTNVDRAPSSVRGELVTAWICARPSCA